MSRLFILIYFPSSASLWDLSLIIPLLKMYINIYAYISTLTVRCKHSFLISIRPKNLFKIFCLSHKNHKMNAKNCIFPIKSGL